MSLDNAIKQLTEKFARDVLATMRAELEKQLGLTPADGVHVDPEHVTQVVASAGKDGMSAIEVAQKLGVSTDKVKRPLARAVADKSLRKRGVRRGTRYFV